MSLTLDDVVRDAFRREFLVLAFPDEQVALARRLALLSHVRHFKTLVGRRDALLHLASACLRAFTPLASFRRPVTD